MLLQSGRLCPMVTIRVHMVMAYLMQLAGHGSVEVFLEPVWLVVLAVAEVLEAAEVDWATGNRRRI